MKIHYPQREELHTPYGNVSETSLKPQGCSFNEAIKQVAEAEKEEQARREAERQEDLEARGEPKNPKGSFLAYMYGEEEKYAPHHYVNAMNPREKA